LFSARGLDRRASRTVRLRHRLLSGNSGRAESRAVERDCKP
jgi:hypothetical protein